MITPIQFYLNGNRNIAELETVEISHPNFSKVYRFVRNHMQGINATIETNKIVNFEYRPIIFDILGFKDDLDQSINISLGTLGEIFPMELKRVRENDGFLIKPTIIYRTYASNDLVNILKGPVNLLSNQFVSREDGTSMLAEAETINNTTTGEIFDLIRFEGLRGYT